MKDYNKIMRNVKEQVLRNEAEPLPVRSTPLLELLQGGCDKAMDVRNETRFPDQAQRYLEVAVAIKHAMNEIEWMKKQF